MSKVVLATSLIFFSISISNSDVIYAREYKVVTFLPEKSAIFQELVAASEKIGQITSKRVVFDYLPSLSIDHQNAINQVVSGYFDGAMINGADLFDLFPDCRLYTLPMLFGSLDEANHVRKNIDPLVFPRDLHPSLMVLTGQGGVFSGILSKHPVFTPEDLTNSMVWVPKNTHVYEALKYDGISTITINHSELHPAVVSGKVDTVITTPMNAIVTRLHLECNYFLKIPLLYSYMAVVYNRNSFESIDYEDANNIKTIFRDVFIRINTLMDSYNADALEILEMNGVKIVDFCAPVRDSWSIWSSLKTGQLENKGALSKTSLEKLRKDINDSRR